MMDWINVNDRLPVKADYGFMYVPGHTFCCVLVMDGDTLTTGLYHSVTKKWTDCDGDELDFVTHWMPLPQRP